MLKREEVFVVGGLPTVTYNPRPDLDLETSLKEHLQSPHKILSVTGPSKLGKTVLVRKVIPQSNAVWLAGGEFEDVEAFWQIVLQQTGGFTEHAESTQETTSTRKGREIVASAKPVGFGGDMKSVSQEDSSTGVAKTAKRTAPASVAALRRLLELRLPLVIDDFHYISQEVQRGLVRNLKQALFDGLPVVVISIPHRAGDVLEAEPDLSGRLRQLRVTPWSIGELAQIANRGFYVLNVSVSPAIIETLAVNSFGSPHLMQELCGLFCNASGIHEQQARLTVFPEPANWQRIFTRYAEEEGSPLFDFLLRESARGSLARVYRLTWGDEIPLQRAILLALSRCPQAQRVEIRQLRNALAGTVQGDLPNDDELKDALTGLSQFASENKGEALLEWRAIDDTLYVSDPFFSFYLRWAASPSEASTVAGGQQS